MLGGERVMQGWSRIAVSAVLLGGTMALAGCKPKEGTPKWCDMMMNKPRGDWTPRQEDIYNDKCAANQIQKQINKLLNH
jgi:hypothetical protein